MRLRPRQGLFVGIAVLAAASVVLEISLGRTWAPLFGPHFARGAPALALAGAALGGTLLAALPRIVRREALLARSSLLSGFAGATTLAALLVTMHVKVPETLGRAAAAPTTAIYLTALLPFVLVGIALAGAFRHAPVLAARIVFAVFAGGALGVPLALGALRAGAPRAGLCAIGAYAFGSLIFYLGARTPVPEAGYAPAPTLVRPRGSLVATFVLAATVLLAGDIGAPWLKLPALRFTAIDKVEVQEWSGLGLTTVDRPQSGVSWIHTDGGAALPIYDGKTAVPLSTDEMAYVLQRDQGPVAIIGGGGGREIRTALKYGQKRVYAVELDPILVRAIMLDRYKKTSGDAYDNPAVKVVLEDARGFLRRSGIEFRNIVLVMPELHAAQAAGALAAEPVDLYTVEAFGDMLAALAPEGTLMATRTDAEADRLVALAGAGLRRVGAADPSQHLYGCSASRSTTLLVRKTPIAAADLVQLRGFCRKNKMTEAFAPDTGQGGLRRRLATDPDASVLSVTSAVLQEPGVTSGPPGTLRPEATDLRPPVDDRPFFAASVPPQLVIATITQKPTAAGAQALLILAAEVAASLVLLFFAFGLPLAASPRWPVPRARAVLFFFGSGACLVFASAALLPQLGVLLGHPIYAFTTSLPALFASLAVGGMVVGRVRASGAESSTGRRAELLVAVLAIAAVALGPVVEVALRMPFAARFGAALLLLVPVGLLGGSLLALGVRLVGAVSPALVPWCFGMAGAGAVVAAALATPAAMVVGYSAVLLAAGLCGLVAAMCVPRAGVHAEAGVASSGSGTRLQDGV